MRITRVVAASLRHGMMWCRMAWLRMKQTQSGGPLKFDFHTGPRPCRAHESAGLRLLVVRREVATAFGMCGAMLKKS